MRKRRVIATFYKWDDYQSTLFEQDMANEAQGFGRNVVKTKHMWFDEGNHLFANGKYEGAIKAYERVLMFEPRIAEAWCNKGN